MKTMLFTAMLLGSSFAYAQDSGLECTMSYSSTGALSTHTDSTTEWKVNGGEMKGSAVSADERGGWTTKPAHYIKIKQQGKTWTVVILNDKKSTVGSFSFLEKQGMKATIPTKAFMANESEDPQEYNKLEVSCSYTVFAG